MSEHICKRGQPSCCCYMLADAPSEDCPIHGCGIDNRCGTCGRFMRYEHDPLCSKGVQAGDQTMPCDCDCEAL